MDVIALRSFREVCRLGSISAAAQALGYTQSALSRQIAALESRLAVPLLQRHARGVRPTAAGAVLLEHAVAILQRVERAERDVLASRERPVTTLRVGGVPTASATLLPRALSLFLADADPDACPDACPDARPDADAHVRVVFVEDFTPRLLGRLREGELDVAVVTDYPPGLSSGTGADGHGRDGIALTHLLDDALRCALPRGHRLATATATRDAEGDDGDNGAPVELAELADETWVEDYEGAAAVLSAACARAGFAPRVDIACGSWLGKQAFVAAGHGVMLVPGLLVPALRPDLVIRPLVDPPRRSVYAAAGPRPSAPAERFVRALRRAGSKS
ncbi:LysR family transcriptional regulator [Streptomyces sp. NPDC047315]|uniref:LysR family transcriptional regulator n=1 Tax=Streptomyces sp. NPDC047315 TaxID=3155142 RepID=UPI0033F9C207